MGFKFKRQYPVIWSSSVDGSEYFILDFYCHELKLGVEIDGQIHKQQKDYDNFRDAILKDLGISTLRFENEALNNLGNFSKKLSEKINELKSDKFS